MAKAWEDQLGEGAATLGVVDPANYTSPETFDREVERIFNRVWIYVGHESEIPEPGSFRRTRIAKTPLILVRAADGGIRLLHNRCRHRGALVCEIDQGTAPHFRCPFHAWTYGTDGTLRGVTHPTGYPEGFDTSDLNLVAARCESYRGLVFGSLAADGPGLLEYLGDARPMIDMVVDASPAGRLTLSAGRQQVAFDANWKIIGMDGYHAAFVHRSVSDAFADDADSIWTPEALAKVSTDQTGNLTHDLGGGHCRLDYWPSLVPLLGRPIEPYDSTDWGREYVAALSAARGEQRARELLTFRSPHTAIFPNLQLIDFSIRVITPVAAGRTEMEIYPVLLEGVPREVNAYRLRQHEIYYGPGGFLSPDDYEMFERTQQGLGGTAESPVVILRGLHRERTDGGHRVGMYSDEVTQRAQHRAWTALMAAGERA